MMCESRFYVVRNGILREDLELLAAEPPRLIMEKDGRIKTALRGTFQTQPGMELLTDHILVQLVLDEVAHPMGEFVVTTCQTDCGFGQELWRLEAYDQTYLVSRNRQENRRTFPAGSFYLDILHTLLRECGITRVLADPCKDTLQTDREWEMGQETLEMVNALLQEMAFDSLWFDGKGYARLTRYKPPKLAAVDHVYKADELSVIAEECSKSWDVFQAKNVFVAVVASPEYPEPLTAKAVNEERSSPISTEHLGRIMAPVIRLDNIASQQALQDYVDRVKLDSMLSTETVTFRTANRPHGVGDLVALEHPHLDGIYQETGWVMDLGYDGQMTHQAKKAVYL